MADHNESNDRVNTVIKNEKGESAKSPFYRPKFFDPVAAALEEQALTYCSGAAPTASSRVEVNRNGSPGGSDMGRVRHRNGGNVETLKIKRRASDPNMSQKGSAWQTMQVITPTERGVKPALHGPGESKRSEQGTKSSINELSRRANHGERKVTLAEQGQDNQVHQHSSQETHQCKRRLMIMEPCPNVDIPYVPSLRTHQGRDIVPSIESDQPAQHGSLAWSTSHSVPFETILSNAMLGSGGFLATLHGDNQSRLICKEH